MSKNAWEFLKESGLLGNLVAAVIIWAVGLLLTFLNLIFALKYNISVSIPLFSLIGVVLISLGALYFVYKLLFNPIRRYSAVFGYYRKHYKSEYSPYQKNEERYYTKIRKSVEYTITRDGITKIEPFEFYAYKPRSYNGEEVLRNIEVTTLLNGHSNILYTEQSNLGSDGCSITIRSNKPLKSGDKVYFSVECMQYGLNAAYQEELDAYKEIPNLKNTMRNRLIKERNVECIYASPSYSLKYIVIVTFPLNYPWRLLENVKDMAVITLSSKPVDKKTMKTIARIKIEDNAIRLEYKHDFRSAHGHYILWRLPKREELNRYLTPNV